MSVIKNRPVAGDSAPVSQIVVASRRAALRDRVSATLADEHTAVVVHGSPEEIEALEFAPDILVLDAATPGLIASRFLSRQRHRWVTVVLVVIGLPDQSMVTELLDAGADDAIAEDADWTQVAARLNAAARRTRTANALIRRRVGDVVYDRENRRVWCAGVEVEFAPRELAVLDALWIRAGELVHHDSLQDYVWSGIEEGERSNRLEVYISYIRRKLRRSNEVTIQTLRGAGYRLVRKSAIDSAWESPKEDE